jgi:hypothetical protein
MKRADFSALSRFVHRLRQRRAYGAVTVSLTFVFFVRVPDVPSMVMVDVPLAAPSLTVSVKVLVEVVGLGLNDAVTPLGTSIAVSVTA